MPLSLTVQVAPSRAGGSALRYHSPPQLQAIR